MLDAHIHLDQYPRDQIERLIEFWKMNDIDGIVAVSTNLHSSYETLYWKDKYPDFVYALVGYHPEQRYPHRTELNELFSLICSEKGLISGIGEVGLPHYSLNQLHSRDAESYRELFFEFASLSKDCSLPLAIHAVHDEAEIALNILLKSKVQKAHFHWLKAPDEIVERIIRSNYYISVTPEVCYRERDQRLALRVPIHQFLLETDGPWPYEGKFANQKTDPTFLFESAQTVANLKKISIKEVTKQCDANVKELYNKDAR